MRRCFALASLVVLSLIAACSNDSRLVEPNVIQPGARPAPHVAITAGTCTTPDNLRALVDTVFGVGSPNYNSARGKVDNLIKQVQAGNIADAQAQAYNIVDFVLKQEAQKGLAGTEAQILRLLNGVLCYSGLSITLSDADNSFLLYPTDSIRTFVSSDSLAGIRFDPSSVSEPTLITIFRIDPTQFTTPGTGPLLTKLDQYPGFYDFDKQSATDAPLTKAAIVAVCLTKSIDPTIGARLRLGHQKQPSDSSQFEITPAVDPSKLDFLSCPDPSTLTSLPAWMQKAVDLLLPQRLVASNTFLLSGGVGGTATELSPFAPTDATLSASGGVGGTATELRPIGPAGGDLMLRKLGGKSTLSSGGAPLASGCTSMEAPIGTDLDPSCRPMITVTTALGTILQNVPVSWAITSGGGLVANDLAGTDPDCGTYGSTASSLTNMFGRVRACWRMGTTPGTNTLDGTPSYGGDAPLGVTFVPATSSFTATANPPSQLTVETQPTSITAGGSVSVTVAARDHNGVIALGWNGSVSATLNTGTFTGSGSASFVNGVATVGPLTITTAGTYTITLSATFPAAPPSTTPVTATVTTNSFTVAPGAAVKIRIVAGDNQTAPAGSTTPIAPTVGVRDQYGNDVPNEGVTWTATLSSLSSVNPASSTTGSNGQTSTAWTLGPDANQLIARIASLPDSSVTFNATGTVTLSVVNSCPLGNNGDPFNDPSKPYGFWTPNPGNNHSVRQVTLYISSAGKANLPTLYNLALDVQVGSWSAPVMTSTSSVTLRGSNSESKAVTFVMPTPIWGGGSVGNIYMRLRVVGTNPDGATLTFNTGPCAPGTSCKPPAGCNATEVTTFPAYGGSGPVPTGSLYRKSVAIVVKGT